MKKQILILVFLFVAIFASVTNSYAQPGHLTPTPGTLYNYAPTITHTTGYSAPVYTWKVILEPAVAPATIDLLTTAGLAGAPAALYYTESAYNAATIDLTWKAAAVGRTFYLVLNLTETTLLGGCNVSNMKVYKIKPASTLLLAVTRVNADGSANAITDVCAPTIASAILTPGAGPASVTYLYNTTTLYYKINASGMDGTFRPALKLPTLPGALSNGQTYASIKIATGTAGSIVAANYANFPGTIADVTTTAGMFSTTTTNDLPVSSAVGGTDYFVEVVINNARYESLAPLPMALAVDGFLPVDYLVSDIYGPGEPTASPTPWVEASAFYKNVAYTILARPTILPDPLANPLAPFVPQVP